MKKHFIRPTNQLVTFTDRELLATSSLPEVYTFTPPTAGVTPTDIHISGSSVFD